MNTATKTRTHYSPEQAKDAIARHSRGLAGHVEVITRLADVATVYRLHGHDELLETWAIAASVVMDEDGVDEVVCTYVDQATASRAWNGLGAAMTAGLRTFV